MSVNQYNQKSQSYLAKLCDEIPERCVGSEGNRIATRFFEEEMSKRGWETVLQEFDAIDWVDGGASLCVKDQSFEVYVSPYSLGCNGEGILESASTISELEQLDIAGKIILLSGEIAQEQLMPKNFVFYNPKGHQKIISVLEKGMPKGIVCATGRNATLAGGVYPFPLIEDGDFDLPSVFMTEDEGRKLLPYVGEEATLNSKSDRIPGKGYNVIARKGNWKGERIVITAHIDAKKGTPGAIDNATGIVVLLLLADLLADYDGDKLIEMVAFNGEDYYSAPGQMLYLDNNINRYESISLNINIDGAGYKDGKSAFSFYGLPEEMVRVAKEVIGKFNGIKVGSQWQQGDHSIFIQNGYPAIAVSSDWFIENIDRQDITHTQKDRVDIVDVEKVVEIALAINSFLRK